MAMVNSKLTAFRMRLSIQCPLKAPYNLCLPFTHSYTHSHIVSGVSPAGQQPAGREQIGEESCSGTPQHSARRTPGQNSHLSGCQKTCWTTSATAAPVHAHVIQYLALFYKDITLIDCSSRIWQTVSPGYGGLYLQKMVDCSYRMWQIVALEYCTIFWRYNLPYYGATIYHILQLQSTIFQNLEYGRLYLQYIVDCRSRIWLIIALKQRFPTF